MKKLSIVAALLFAFGVLTFGQSTGGPRGATPPTTNAKTDKKPHKKTKKGKAMDKKADNKMAPKTNDAK